MRCSYYKEDIPPLSIQQIVDCSKKQKNNGCNGGLMEYVYNYIKDEGGLSPADKYREYDQKEGKCETNPETYILKDLGDYKQLSCDEKVWMDIIDSGIPIFLAVDATTWQYYKGNIIKGSGPCCLNRLNHAVECVGYGTDSDGNSYWLIKNSWGEKWGESGYIRLAAGENCNGMFYYAGYITKKTAAPPTTTPNNTSD